MIFDRNIIKIIFDLNDSEVDEVYADYVLKCCQKAEEVYTLLEDKISKDIDFVQDIADLRAEIESEEPDLDRCLDKISNLEENEDFSKTFNLIIDGFNSNLIAEANKRNSATESLLTQYLNSLENLALRTYVDSIREEANIILDDQVNQAIDEINAKVNSI